MLSKCHDFIYESELKSENGLHFRILWTIFNYDQIKWSFNKIF